MRIVINPKTDDGIFLKLAFRLKMLSFESVFLFIICSTAFLIALYTFQDKEVARSSFWIMFISVLLYAIYAGIVYSSFKKYYKNTLDSNQLLEYTFTDEKLFFKTSKTEMSLMWNAFSKVENTKHILLFSRPGTRAKVPFLKSWFTNDELAELMDFIKSNNRLRKVGF